MKRTLAVLPLVMALAACGSLSSDPYEKRAERERDRQQAQVQRALDQAPDWMRKLPKSDSAVYENGTAVSTDMGMSVNKAKTVAFGKLCMAAGGRVDQQSKLFISDRENTSTEISDLAIRSFCPGVDISGAEMVETHMIADGTRFRAYVLIALPTGEANAIQRAREQRELRNGAEQRSRDAFRELDANQSRPAQ
jgi:hypothetical protein